jgi:hypothetical protein
MFTLYLKVLYFLLSILIYLSLLILCLSHVIFFHFYAQYFCRLHNLPSVVWHYIKHNSVTPLKCITLWVRKSGVAQKFAYFFNREAFDYEWR